MKFLGMDVTFKESISKNDSNVQDYVNGTHALKDGSFNKESNDRMVKAAQKLPKHIKTELDERLKRGSI